MIANCFPISD